MSVRAAAWPTVGGPTGDNNTQLSPRPELDPGPQPIPINPEGDNSGPRAPETPPGVPLTPVPDIPPGPRSPFEGVPMVFEPDIFPYYPLRLCTH